MSSKSCAVFALCLFVSCLSYACSLLGGSGDSVDLNPAKIAALADELDGWADTIEVFLNEPGEDLRKQKYEPHLSTLRLTTSALRGADFEGSLIATLRSLGDPFQEVLVLMGRSPSEAALIRRGIGSALTVLEFSVTDADG